MSSKEAEMRELLAEMKSYTDRHNLMEEDFLYVSGLLRRAALAGQGQPERMISLAAVEEYLRKYPRNSSVDVTISGLRALAAQPEAKGEALGTCQANGGEDAPHTKSPDCVRWVPVAAAAPLPEQEKK